MKKSSSKRLSLSHETIRKLSSGELRSVGGGIYEPTRRTCDGPDGKICANPPPLPSAYCTIGCH